jgi:hypothetical protein
MEFQEYLIAPRKGERPDGLTLWFIRTYIPLYDRLRRQYLLPFWQKYFLSLLRALASVSHRVWPAKQRSEDPEKNSSVPPDNGPSPSAPAVTTNTSESSIADTFFLNYYSGSYILRMTIVLTTVGACLFPTLAISVLAFVDSKNLVLGLIATFTALFALGLYVLQSHSSREQVFLATVA